MQHSDRVAAAQWARAILADPRALILDSETTGLDADAEIIELAVIDMAGGQLLNTRVRPTRPIPHAATQIHGITDADVATASPIGALLDDLTRLLGGRTVVIYNMDYDIRLLEQTLRAHHLLTPQTVYPLFGAQYACAMLPYSAWVGDWNEYYGNYRWQRLPGGDHSALGDARATLAVLRMMAEG